MHRVTTSAPGKVILFGEHSVVFGQDAIAASISDLRVSVTIEFRPPASTLTIEFLDLKSEATDGILRRSYTRSELDLLPTNFPPHPSISILDNLTNFLHQDHPAEKKVLLPTLFLLRGLLLRTTLDYGLEIRISSTNLPVGAGLGSSAAFSVALAAALIASQEKLQLQDHEPTLETRECINKWAFAAETILQGTPSGLDNTTSCFGGAMLFNRTRTPKFERIPLVEAFAGYKVLVTNTQVSRNSKALIAKVAQLKSRFPKIIDPVIEGMGQLVTEFREWCKTVHEHNADENFHELSTLVEVNHHLLCSLGVGHEAFDTIRQITSQVQVSTKLTGAGGGGCAISFFPLSKEKELQQVKEQLQQKGFNSIETSIAGPGVQITYL